MNLPESRASRSRPPGNRLKNRVTLEIEFFTRIFLYPLFVVLSFQPGFDCSKLDNDFSESDVKKKHVYSIESRVEK